MRLILKESMKSPHPGVSFVSEPGSEFSKFGELFVVACGVWACKRDKMAQFCCVDAFLVCAFVFVLVFVFLFLFSFVCVLLFLCC